MFQFDALFLCSGIQSPHSTFQSSVLRKEIRDCPSFVKYYEYYEFGQLRCKYNKGVNTFWHPRWTVMKHPKRNRNEKSKIDTKHKRHGKNGDDRVTSSR